MEENWNDYNFVMQKVKEFGGNLMYASKELRNNFNIVKEAVRENEEAFWYVSEELRNNEQIINEYSNHYITINEEQMIYFQLNSQIKQINTLLQKRNQEEKNTEKYRNLEMQLLKSVVNAEIKHKEIAKSANTNSNFNIDKGDLVNKENVCNILSTRYPDLNKNQIEQILVGEQEYIESINKREVTDAFLKEIINNLEEKIEYYNSLYEKYKDTNLEKKIRTGMVANIQNVLDIQELYNNKEEYINKNIQIQIKDASELSIEELEALEKDFNIVSIKFDDVNIKPDYASYAYDTESYKMSRAKIDELLEGVEKQEELPMFMQIVNNLARNIRYDYNVKEYDYGENTNLNEDEKYEVRRRLRNLEGGLLDNVSVCGGYAEILRNVLACVGIESRYIRGYRKESQDGHAWNQVKIDDIWYNVDLTLDRDKIVKGEMPQYMLKSDEEFGHKEYEKVEQKEKCCIKSIPQEIISQYFGKRKVIQDVVSQVKQSDIDKVQEMLITKTEHNKVKEDKEERV